jgi:hypothetical protein
MEGPGTGVVMDDPRVTADDDDEAERRPVLNAQRPRWIEHTSQQERAASPRPFQECGEGVHGRIVDAKR